MQLVGIASAQRDSGVTSYPSTLSPNAVINPLQGNIFTVITSNVPDGFNVLVPVWSEQNGQDDLTWYLSANVGNGNHIATIDVSLHHVAGIYAVHVYLQDVAGNLYPVLASGIDVPASAISTKVTVNTPIMGLSSVTAADLSNMYVAHSPIAFPDYYVARGVSLGQFAQMYVEEAAAEGVRADIAFSQAMEETGFLKFGGDVQISQFNFAGLGATGGGVRGEDFTQYGDNANGIRMGIRAQIQHLKAYASTDPLNQACVDARFNYVSRGKAPTINGLSGTWAADTSYAPKIVTICNYI